MNHDRTEKILNLARSFMESRIILTGAELNLFTILTPAPLSPQEVAKITGGDLRPLTILLDALAALGFLAKSKDSYQCSLDYAPFLSAESPSSILPMLRHMNHLWRRWSELTHIVRGFPSPTPPASSEDTEELKAFIEAMHVVSAQIAPRIVSLINPGSSRALLDVGGASGTYMLAFLQAAPKMKATLFDRPRVVDIARKRLGEAGVLHRVTLVAGDFYNDELPPGHDLAFASAIIHQNSPDENVALFRKIYRSLNPGGRIVIRDYVMSGDRIHPADGAVFAVNMVLGTTGGNTCTYEEIKAGLQEAGFTGIRLLHEGEHMDSLVEGWKA